MDVSFLGKFDLRRNGQPVELPSRQAQALLAYLLLSPGTDHRRDQLAGLLWPDSPESSARKNLRNAIWQLRRAIGDAYLVAEKETVAFNAQAPLEFDVRRLEAAAPDRARLVAAVAAYQGELLPGFYEDWVARERERLHGLFERRMQALLDQLTRAGEWEEVQRWAEHWIAKGQVPEPAYRALMLAYAGRGDQAGVAGAYRRCVAALQEGVGVAPSPETVALHQRLSSGRPQPAPIATGSAGRPPAPPPDSGLRQQIQFCTAADGVRLAYATVGAGPPLVKAANWLSHLEYDWTSPVWRHWLLGLAEHNTLIRYDERGCGLSDWDAGDISFDAWLADLEAVVEATRLERFALLGLSKGGALAVAYAARHPERVSRLILYGAFARGRENRSLAPEQRLQTQVMADLIRVGWGQESPAFRQVFASLFIPGASLELLRAFDELQRVSASAENAVRIFRASGPVDVRHLATQVQAPTLVMHARGDQRVPYAEGRLLATLIPGARFVTLESQNHILLADEPAWRAFQDEVQAFL